MIQLFTLMIRVDASLPPPMLMHVDSPLLILEIQILFLRLPQKQAWELRWRIPAMLLQSKRC